MKRAVVATPLFARRLQGFLDEYANKGAARLIEKLRGSYRAMVESIARFEEMGPARRRTVGGKTITVREHVLDAGARDFLVLYWVPAERAEPIVLLNVRAGGQSRFRWEE